MQVNGTDITRLTFNGQASGKQQVVVSPTLLRDGDNRITLIAEGGTSDVSLVDAIRLTYSHRYQADNNALRLTVPANQQLIIGGFTRSDLRVLDVTDASAVQEVATSIAADKDGNYTLTAVASGSGTRTLLAFADAQAKHPAGVSANQPSIWRQASNGAELLIVTPRAFFNVVEPLKALCQSQSLSVAVVDIDDIYDEFNFGNPSPQAISCLSASRACDWVKRCRRRRRRSAMRIFAGHGYS